MYYVAVTIPCQKENQISVWWRVARNGYNFTHENGFAKIYGRRKTQDEVDALKEALKAYPKHTIVIEEGDV